MENNQTPEYLNIVTNQNKKLRIAYKDLPVSGNWHKAQDTVKKHYPWRIPTIDELEAMYNQLHKKGLGNFKNGIYWSNSEFGDTVAWYFDFEKGMDGTALKIFACNIRLALNIK